jgi:hypothetical protein
MYIDTSSFLYCVRVYLGGLEGDPRYTSPTGLFIPSIHPDQQRRQHTPKQQALQKPRSQAIPIVSPTVGREWL